MKSTITHHIKDNKMKNNKTKQEINKSYNEKLKTTNEEKYQQYLKKCRERYFKDDKYTKQLLL